MKKVLYSAIIGVSAFTIVGGAVALAYGPMFEDTAGFMGMTTDELKIELESKTMPEILDEKGITHQQMFELREGHMLEKQAETLGIAVDELKAELENKTFAQLLDEAGISHTAMFEQHHQQKQERMTEHLQQMVDDGDITTEQMQEKLDLMKEKTSGGFGGHSMKHGFGMGFHGF